jgi:hypothetical protein
MMLYWKIAVLCESLSLICMWFLTVSNMRKLDRITTFMHVFIDVLPKLERRS